MINMMYLVLTAMLALNVASEVLESFRVIDASLVQTLNNVDSKNDQIYSNFYAAHKENPTKVEAWKNKADQVKQKTDALITKIQDLKTEMVLLSGGLPKKEAGADFILTDEPIVVGSKGDTTIITKLDDLNVPSQVMITQKKATELKNSLNEYRDFLLSLLDEKDPLRDIIIRQLATPDSKPNLKEGGEVKKWEVVYFENKPMIAVVTLLSKIQIDVENTETSVISSFYSNIDAASFKFNQLEARILPKSNYVIKGDQFEAEIYLAAIDTTQDPQVFVGNTEIRANNEKKFIYKASTGEVGTKTWGGIINFKNPDGTVVPYPFKGEYQVGLPNVTISPTKMNVFYIGVANPVEISVPGVASENLSVSVSNGRIEKRADGYFVYPAKLDVTGKITSITVSAKMGTESRVMGTEKFRVKEVPPPLATISGKNGGVLRKEELIAEQGVFADQMDFDFDMKFKVTQFEVTTSGSGGFSKVSKATSNKFTQEQKDLFSKLGQGSTIIIDNITARGDDGKDRPLSPITFKIR